MNRRNLLWSNSRENIDLALKGNGKFTGSGVQNRRSMDRRTSCSFFPFIGTIGVTEDIHLRLFPVLASIIHHIHSWSITCRKFWKPVWNFREETLKGEKEEEEEWGWERIERRKNWKERERVWKGKKKLKNIRNGNYWLSDVLYTKHITTQTSKESRADCCWNKKNTHTHQLHKFHHPFSDSVCLFSAITWLYVVWAHNNLKLEQPSKQYFLVSV